MEHGQKWDVAEEGGRDKQKPEYRERSQAKGMRDRFRTVGPLRNISHARGLWICNPYRLFKVLS